MPAGRYGSRSEQTSEKGRRQVMMVSLHPYPAHPQLRRNVQYLLSQGFVLDLVCLASSNLPDWGPRAQPGLRTFRIRMNHRRTPAFWYLVEYLVFFFRALPIVCRLGLTHRYTVVQVDNLPDPLVFLALVPRWRGARVVLNLFEHMSELTATRLRIGMSHPLVRLSAWMERRAHGFADHVLSVSEPGRDLVLANGVDSRKISVIPNSLPPSPGSEWRPTTPPVLLVLTTLVERYGVQVVIHALAQLRRDWPDLRLRVLGTGEQRSRLLTLAAEVGVLGQVEFIPFSPWPQAMAQVRGATLGVVPLMPDRYSELMLPTKLLDYVQHGLPVVCARLPTIEAQFPSDTVAYFAPGDAAGLAAQVDRLLRHPDDARRQAARAREAVRPLSWEIVGPRYLAALGLSGNGTDFLEWSSAEPRRESRSFP